VAALSPGTATDSAADDESSLSAAEVLSIRPGAGLLSILDPFQARKLTARRGRLSLSRQRDNRPRPDAILAVTHEQSDVCRVDRRGDVILRLVELVSRCVGISDIQRQLHCLACQRRADRPQAVVEAGSTRCSYKLIVQR
jgi:hypothetical protein